MYLSFRISRYGFRFKKTDCHGIAKSMTSIKVSPLLVGSLMRCRHHIRASFLPDKEFRYLRTVIVTAAVHWGFSSKRKLLPLTFQHWAGVSPYTSTFVFAETCVFGKQLHGFFSCGPVTVPTMVRAYRGQLSFLNFTRSKIYRKKL
jgi:hypothetical protein